jgi:hypothetical protein
LDRDRLLLDHKAPMLREEYSPRRSRSKGGSLTMLRDAGELVAALLISGQRKPHRQTAAAALLSAAERGGIMMLAEIAMRRRLVTVGPRPTRKKAAKMYRIIR